VNQHYENVNRYWATCIGIAFVSLVLGIATYHCIAVVQKRAIEVEQLQLDQAKFRQMMGR